MPNLQKNRNRCDFYTNHVLAAMRHLFNIWLHFQRSGTRSPEEIMHVKTLRDNLKAIYELLYQLPAMGDYFYRPAIQTTSEHGRLRFLVTREQLQCLRNEFNSWTQIASDLEVGRQTNPKAGLLFVFRKPFGDEQRGP